MTAVALVGNMIKPGGGPASGCKLNSYIRGTTTRSPLFTSASIDPVTSPKTPNPYVGDADGRLAFWFDSTIQYTWSVTTSDGATILWEADIVGGVVTITYASGVLIHSSWAPALGQSIINVGVQRLLHTNGVIFESPVADNDITNSQLFKWYGQEVNSYQTGVYLVSNTAAAGDFSSIRLHQQVLIDRNAASNTSPGWIGNGWFDTAATIPVPYGDHTSWQLIGDQYYLISNQAERQIEGPAVSGTVNGSHQLITFTITGTNLGFPHSSYVNILFLDYVAANFVYFEGVTDVTGAIVSYRHITTRKETLTGWQEVTALAGLPIDVTNPLTGAEAATPFTMTAGGVPGTDQSFVRDAQVLVGTGIVSDIGPILHLTRQMDGLYQLANSTVGGIEFGAQNDAHQPYTLGYIFAHVVNPAANAGRSEIYVSTSDSAAGTHTPSMVFGYKSAYSHTATGRNAGPGTLNFEEYYVNGVLRLYISAGVPHIDNTSNAPIMFDDPITISTATSQSLLIQGSTSPYINMISAANVSAYFQASPTAGAFGTITSHPVELYAGNQLAMSVPVSGAIQFFRGRTFDTDSAYDDGDGTHRLRDSYIARDLYRPGGTQAIFRTQTAITSGGAAAVGTLTNAPAAGNPTKWIPINDNGTTRYLPAW